MNNYCDIEHISDSSYSQANNCNIVRTEYSTIACPTPLQDQVDGKVNEPYKNSDIIDSNQERNIKQVVHLNNELRKAKISIAVIGSVFISVLIAAIILASLAVGNSDKNYRERTQLKTELGKLTNKLNNFIPKTNNAISTVKAEIMETSLQLATEPSKLEQ